MILKTPLYDQHLALNAQMVDFCGWYMPLRFGGEIEEHHSVRKDAGMFDVSHMTILDIKGAQTRYFLRYLLANDVEIVLMDQKRVRDIHLSAGDHTA